MGCQKFCQSIAATNGVRASGQTIRLIGQQETNRPMSTTEALDFQQTETARLLVCERTGWWTALLRKELAATEVPVLQTLSLADCWKQLKQSPASFVVMELTMHNAKELLLRLASMERRFPCARAAVVADRWLAEYQWVVRAAGAVWFCCSPRQLAAIAAIACRHLAQVPQPRQSFAQRVWASLPWKRLAERQ